MIREEIEKSRSYQSGKAAVEYANSIPQSEERKRYCIEDFEAGVEWADQHPSEEAKKKMITRAIAWVEWNNRNGSCLFDGWKESLRETMKGE